MAETKATKTTKAAKPAKAAKATKVKKAKAPQEATTTEFRTMQFQDFTISKKRSGRFEVTTKKGKNVNGADKSKILVDAKLVQASLPKAKEEAAPAEPHS